ncbi:MAG: type II toxin-antitoxin system RelE/ParE family toxin [Zetaproteobacteria bacterium]|nr:type II toxin-antitoxin system RelE/ParE family toxin [Zetaproteobacteria bacterium]
MKIRYKESFKDRFNCQLAYIAKDNPANARKFRDALRTHFESVREQPYRCRQSIYFDDITIRYFIFKGYIVVYKIRNESIDVFGFTKYQLTPYDT